MGANMLEKGKERRAELEAGVIVRTASDIRQKSTNFYPPLEERMETPIATSEHNHRTLKNKDGNFPKWMSKTKVDKHKKVIKKKKASMISKISYDDFKDFLRCFQRFLTTIPC